MDYFKYFGVQWPSPGDCDVELNLSPYQIGGFNDNSQSFLILDAEDIPLTFIPKQSRDGFRILNNKIIVLAKILSTIASVPDKTFNDKKEIIILKQTLVFCRRVSKHYPSNYILINICAVPRDQSPGINN
jgi:hypothetical protein